MPWTPGTSSVLRAEFVLKQLRIAICTRLKYDSGMNALSVKLPSELFLRLANEARRRNIDRSTLVREILNRSLSEGPTADATTCADLAGDLAGSVASGRSDLATNKELLEQAMLGDSFRGRPDGTA